MRRWTLVTCVIFGAACGRPGEDRGVEWEGSIDTLSTGQIVVLNTGAGAWGDGEEWRVTETLRVGSVMGEGPATFGQIRSMELDSDGRLWILDGQAKDIRVFDAAGAHIRTIGRSGSGPGEFAEPVRVDFAPDGDFWVMDPMNSRLSRFDTSGVYVAGYTAAGGFITLPWPGGFDDEDRYYAPVPKLTPDFHMALAQYDIAFNPVDTLTPPRDSRPRPQFTIERDGLTRVAAGVPFSGSLIWRMSPAGTLWALVTDEYRLFELSNSGDTIRTVLRSFDPLPVTRTDIETAIEDLQWFTNQGGQVDRSVFPSQKPGASSFFIDDERHLWVAPVTGEGDEGRRWDIFHSSGQLLGRVELPFTLAMSPLPRVRNGVLYGSTTDELDVPYAILARIDR